MDFKFFAPKSTSLLTFAKIFLKCPYIPKSAHYLKTDWACSNASFVCINFFFSPKYILVRQPLLVSVSELERLNITPCIEHIDGDCSF